jgi:hypothetical protein
MEEKSFTIITTDLKMQFISMFILGRRYEMKMKAAEDRMRALGKYKPYFIRMYSFTNTKAELMKVQFCCGFWA